MIDFTLCNVIMIMLIAQEVSVTDTGAVSVAGINKISQNLVITSLGGSSVNLSLLKVQYRLVTGKCGT